MRSSELDASEVWVHVKDGNVSLEGSVPERFMKHQIEDMAANCPGVKHAENKLRGGNGQSRQENTTSLSDSMGFSEPQGASSSETGGMSGGGPVGSSYARKKSKSKR